MGGLRPGTSAEELPCSRGTTALANQRRRCLFPSDWPVVGNFYWTYTSTIFPTAAGFGFSGLCFWVAVVMRTKNSRPANPSKPSELPRMPFVSCLSPVSSYPPGPLPSRCSVLSTAVARRSSLGVGHSHPRRRPTLFMQAAQPSHCYWTFRYRSASLLSPPLSPVAARTDLRAPPSAPLLKSYCSALKGNGFCTQQHTPAAKQKPGQRAARHCKCCVSYRD